MTDTTGTETIVETKVETIPTIPLEDDSEAKIASLESEKNKLIEESANYKVAYLKEKKRNKENFDDEEDPDDKMRRIASEAVADSRLAEIAREQDSIIKKALKENKELKLAHLNKTDIPASTTTHSESQGVKDTLITEDQSKAFKARGWTDKDIERYKKNLLRYGGR